MSTGRDGWRRIRAEAVVRKVLKDADPEVRLARLGELVDDLVISGLADASYRAQKQEQPDEALRLADLAVHASLLGGTAAGRAEAFSWRSTVLVDQYELAERALPNRPKQNLRNDPFARAFARSRLRSTAELAARGLLERALDDAVKASDIFSQHGPPSSHASCLLQVAQVHGLLEDHADQMNVLLACALTLENISDLGIRSRLRRQISGTYWALTGRQAEQLAPRLVDTLGPGGLGADGDIYEEALLLEVAAAVYCDLSRSDAAWAATSQAGRLFHKAGHGHDAFIVWHRMTWHLAGADDDRVFEAADQCRRYATPQTVRDDLATIFYLEARAFQIRDQVEQGLEAFARARELLEADGKPTGNVLFDSAQLMISARRYAEARHALESVGKQSGGEYLFWAAEIELAQLCSRHLSDLGAAIEHADFAANMALTIKYPMLRVYSLYTSASLHAQAGDWETAHLRFQALNGLLTEPSTPILLRLNRVFEYFAIVPTRHKMLREAAETAARTGRRKLAEFLLVRARQFVEEELATDLLTDDDSTTSEQERHENAVLNQALQSANLGGAVVIDDPRAALFHFESAARATTDPRMYVEITAQIAGVHLRLGDHEAAQAALALVLADPRQLSNELLYTCRMRMAAILSAQQDHDGAYEQLIECLRADELSRSALTGIDQRTAFLGERLAVYEQLITTCLHLDRAAEAFAIMQHVKSRALLDLLAQPEHRRFDNDLDARSLRLKAERDQWFIANAVGAVDGANEDVENWPSTRALSTSIELRREEERINAQRQATGVFDRLVGESNPLTYALVRELCSGD